MDPSNIDKNKYLYTRENVHKNLSLEELAKYAYNSDGFICYDGKTLVVDSGEIKGRLPDDKYIVETKYAKKNIWWREDGSDNKRLKRKNWKLIKEKLLLEVATKDLFIVDGFYNHDERYTIAVRLITTQASAAYFLS